MTLILPGSLGKAKGYAVIEADDGNRSEADTVQCCHCQYVMFVKPGSGRERGYCYNCNGIVCGKQACMDRCLPFEAKLEAWEGRRRLYQSFRQGF